MWAIYRMVVQGAYFTEDTSRPSGVEATLSGGTNPFGKTWRTLTLILVVAIYAANGDQSSAVIGRLTNVWSLAPLAEESVLGVRSAADSDLDPASGPRCEGSVPSSIRGTPLRYPRQGNGYSQTVPLS
jgi:hypothetical protein